MIKPIILGFFDMAEKINGKPRCCRKSKFNGLNLPIRYGIRGKGKEILVS